MTAAISDRKTDKQMRSLLQSRCISLMNEDVYLKKTST